MPMHLIQDDSHKVRVTFEDLSSVTNKGLSNESCATGDRRSE
jgi:hypothetical protein